MNVTNRRLCSRKCFTLLLLALIVPIRFTAWSQESAELKWVDDEWKRKNVAYETQWHSLLTRLARSDNLNETDYVNRFKSEYASFARTKTDPQRLYSVSLAFWGASYTNNAFRKEHRNSKERWAIIQAWRQMPSQNCYEFSRLGYIFLSFYDRSAGTTDMGKYDSKVEDLGLRLHKKEPANPYIMIGYIQLCYNRGDTPDKCMLQCKEFGDLLIELKRVRPGFWMTRCKAYFVYGSAKGVDKWEQRKIAKQAAEKYMKLKSNDPVAQAEAKAWI